MTDWFAGAAAEHQDDDTTHLPVEPVVDVLVVGVPSGDRLSVFALGDTHVGASGRISLRPARRVWTRSSVPFRAVSAGQLDLMARLAGLQLRERWSDWTREPFTAASRSHVSVWDQP